MKKLQPLKYVKGKSNSKDDKVTPIIDFLNEHYHIHINELNPKQVIVQSKQKKYNHPVTIDDVIIHLNQEGIEYNETLLKRILRSPNQLPTFNPLQDYFKSLEYKGVSQIDILCQHLKAIDYGDKEKDYYQNRLNRLLKKWLISCVACSLDNVPNEVALGLVQEQEGTGKTFLARFLLPEPLNDLFCTSQNDTQKFDIEKAITSSFMILYDECIGMNSRQAETFKKALSTHEVNMPSTFTHIRKRIGNIVFTSNNRTGKNRGFLTPALGYRRFACLHLEEIDQDYSQKVDVNELWAEAYELYKNGFDDKFGMDDFEEFQTFNERFKMETIASSLIEHYFSIPQEGENATFIQPIEIVERLRKLKAIRAEYVTDITPKKVGEALTQLGYEKTAKKRDGKSRYGYYVRMI